MSRIFVAAITFSLGLGACASEEDDATRPDEGSQTQAASTCTANVAITSVTASGAQVGNPASQAIDGDLATRWSQEGAGAAITVDLGAARSLCGVKLAWYQGNTRTNHFTVSVSSDGNAFAAVSTATSSGTTTALEQTTFAAATARYLRVTFASNSVNAWASITELQVQGAGFVHPGVLVGGAQLTNVKQKIAANAAPWKRAYDELAGNKYVRSGWTASPRATIECGPSNGPDLGCSQEFDDANAAYSNALMWAYTGTAGYADVAIAVLNAYARTVKSHTNSNAPLESGWAAERFVRAAEIIRYTSNRWASADIAAFAAFMRSVYLPLVQDGWPWGNGNWDLTMIDATVAIAVFTDDRPLFDAAIAKWKQRVPAYIYLTSDGPLPVRPTGTNNYASASAILALWIWPMTGSGTTAQPAVPLPDGLAQETCRDFGHVALGLTSMTATAETAYLQGVDLYNFSNFATRLTKTLEFHARYLNGAAIPATLCGGETAHRKNVGFLDKAPLSQALNFEVGYNHYANRAHVSLPQTQQSLITIDSNGSAYRNKISQTAVYENLTNAEQ